MARFVQFEQDPEMPAGVGTFHRDDGTSIYGQDEEIAQSLAGPDMRLADNSGGSGGMSNASGSMSDAGSMPTNPQPMTGQLANDPFRPEIISSTSAPQAPPPAPTPAAEQAPPPALAAQQQTQDTGIPMRYVAPSAGGYRPKGQTTTIEDTQPYDEDAAAVRQDLSINEQLLNQARTDRAIAEQQARAEALRAQVPELRKRADLAQAEERKREQEYTRERADLDTLIKSVAEKKVNPDAIYEDRPWARVVSALAAGFGAYGAAMTGSKNFAQEAIDSAIDRSMQAQRADIEQGNEKVRNTLGTLKERYGSWEQAQSAFKLAGSHIAEAEAKEVAAMLGTQQAQDAFAQWQIDHVKKRNEEEQNFRNLARGKVKTTVSEEYQAASGGGMAPDLTELKREAAIAKLRGDITENNSRAAGGPSQKMTAKLGEKLADTESTLEAFDSTAREIGLTQDPKTGGFSVPPGKDVAGAGVWDATVGKYIPNSDSSKAAQNLGSVLSAYIKAMSGAAATEGEVERLKAQLFGSVPTEEAVAHGMSLLRNNLKAQRQTLKAGYGPGTARAVRENRRAVEADEREEAADAEEY